MAIEFHDTPMDKLLSIHFPSGGDIATLHFDFQWESFHESTYASNFSSVVPSVQGLSADLQAQVTTLPNSITTIPPKLNFWAYQQQKDVTERVIGGTVTIVDKGLYWPEISWKVGDVIQSALITISPYHGLILPLRITSDDDTTGGYFTGSEASAILANVQAHFDQDNQVNSFNAAWKLAEITQSHQVGGSAIATRIEFAQLYVFHLGRIKAATKNKARFLDLAITLQGELSSELANYWNIELITFKKPPQKGRQFLIGPDEDMNAVAPFAPDVSDILYHHEFSESNKPPFVVTFHIDLKTLKATGTSTG